MQTRTEISIPKSKIEITRQTNLTMLGSCFTERIGDKLTQLKFDVSSNPFGTMFNPISLLNAFIKPTLNESHFIERDDLFFHLDLHSDMRAHSREELQNLYAQHFKSINERLQSESVLIITLGTAFVYEFNETKKIIANCHKVPQKEFTRRLLTVEEIKESISCLREFFPQIQKVILTVSPVRHTKDTLQLNAVSKSILRLACHDLQKNHDWIEYFPAYEIVMDDLRDYRYFENDFIHPNQQAVEYIWELFQQTYMSEVTISMSQNIEGLLRAAAHRSFNPASAAHQKFLKSTLNKIEALPSDIDFNSEIDLLKSQIIDQKSS